MTITLIGYRGTGKSCVAQLLAERLELTAIDADDVIEERAGRSIREIFAEQGEPGFRALERNVMAELLRRDRIVIAAGGGAVLNEVTRREMAAAGPVIWLQASPATIAQRMRDDASTRDRRPALTAADPLQEIVTLLAVREPLYRETASAVVVTDDRTVDSIAGEIIARLPAGGRG